MEPLFRSEAALDRSLFLHYLQAVYNQVAAKYRRNMLIASAALLAGGVLLTAFRGFGMFPVFCFGGACITAYMCFFGYRSQLKPLLKSYRDEYGADAKMVTSFYEHKITLGFPEYRTSFRYDTVERIAASPEMIVVFSRQNLMLPRDSFTVGNAGDFLAFIEKKSRSTRPPNKSLRSGWRSRTTSARWRSLPARPFGI